MRRLGYRTTNWTRIENANTSKKKKTRGEYDFEIVVTDNQRRTISRETVWVDSFDEATIIDTVAWDRVRCPRSVVCPPCPCARSGARTPRSPSDDDDGPEEIQTLTAPPPSPASVTAGEVE